MKIVSTRSFACDKNGAPLTREFAQRAAAVELPRTPPPSNFTEEATTDVGGAWLAATGIVDSQRAELLAAALAATSGAVVEPELDAWSAATGARRGS